MKTIQNALILLGILLAVILFVFGIPWPAVVHALLLFAYIKWLSILTGVILTVGTLIVLKDEKDWGLKLTAIGIFSIIPTLALMLVTGIWSNYTLANTINVQYVDRPATLAASWIPETVADNYVTDHYNRTDSHPGLIDPWTQTDGKVNWVFADTANFPFGLKNPKGLTTVKPGESINNLTLTPVKNSQGVEIKPSLGESEIVWFKSFQFRTLIHGNVFSKFPELYYAQGTDTQWYALAPLTTYKLSLPQPIPQPGKLVTFNLETGEYRKLSREDAHALFPNQWLVNRPLATRFVKVLQNKTGLWNVWFAHKEQIVPGDLTGILHPIEYNGEYLSTWYFSLEPYGKAKGQVAYAYVSGTDGTVLIDELDENDKMNATGFGSIVGATQSVLTKDYNWVHDYKVSTGESSTNVKSGNSLLLDPRPVSVENRLMALMSITGRGAETVSQGVLADVVTKEVMILNDEAQFEQVLAGNLPFVPYIPGQMVYNVINCDDIDTSQKLSDVTTMTKDELWQEAQTILSELQSRS